MTTMNVSHLELVKILYERKGSAFIGFDAETSPKLNKRHRETKEPCPFTNLVKHSKVNGLVTFDYESMMERRGDEAAGTGNWSQAIIRPNGSLTPLSCHKDDIQYNGSKITWLSTRPRIYLRYEQKSSESYYTDNGKKVEKENVYPYLPPYKPQTVAFRTLKISNLKRLTIDKVTYILPD